MKGGRVGWVAAEAAETEGENQRGPSQRGRCGGGGERRPASPPPITIPTHNNTQHSCKQTLLHEITKVTFFNMELIFNNFEAGKSITGALEGVGPGNLDFFWAQMAFSSLVTISGPKEFQFIGPTPPSSNAPHNGSCPPQNPTPGKQ
jgi:hypothetical protein